LEWSLKTVLAPRSYIASVLYHDAFWYPSHQRIVRDLLGSAWGRLFRNWERLALPPDDLETPGWEDVGKAAAELHGETMALLKQSMRILGTCIREAPEFDARRRHRHARAGGRSR
jgi:hypothetical protein